MNTIKSNPNNCNQKSTVLILRILDLELFFLTTCWSVIIRMVLGDTPEIVPFQPISLMPSAKIFHYGQSIFEGMKAYKDADKKTWLFRPDENFKRFNISAKRLVHSRITRSGIYGRLESIAQG